MIYLNYTNLNQETQERLFQTSKKDVEQQFGKDIQEYASKHYLNYHEMLDEEAFRNLYKYRFVFNI